MVDSYLIDILWGANMVLKFIKQNIQSYLPINNLLNKKFFPFSKKSRLKGQATVEMILLLSFFLVLATLISTALEENEVAKTIIGKPWKVISGMIESGTWEEKAGNDQHPLHPVILNNRHLSVEGD